MITRTVEEFVTDLLTLCLERGVKPIAEETVGDLAKRIGAAAELSGTSKGWREVFGTALTAEIDWWEATPLVGLVSIWNGNEFENPPRVEKDPS